MTFRYKLILKTAQFGIAEKFLPSGTLPDPFNGDVIAGKYKGFLPQRDKEKARATPEEITSAINEFDRDNGDGTTTRMITLPKNYDVIIEDITATMTRRDNLLAKKNDAIALIKTMDATTITTFAELAPYLDAMKILLVGPK